jgi:hypothetical protein
MTQQVPESLILEGEKTFMASCPPLNPDHPRILQVEPEWESTGCWRGYIGTWEIKDGRLYLVHVTGQYRLTAGDPVLADWVTGLLHIPRGALLRREAMGCVYEQEVQLKIEKGEVVASRVFDTRNIILTEWHLLRWFPGGLEGLPKEGKKR